MNKTNELFIILVTSLASSCWVQLGKIPNPQTNIITKNLEEAKLTIEMLRMLNEKTKGNLSADEERLLLGTIADLELNYADELNKQQHNQGNLNF